jgi:hypothetical protein
MLFGLSVSGRFVEGWIAKQFDSTLPVDYGAAYLSIHSGWQATDTVRPGAIAHPRDFVVPLMR